MALSHKKLSAWYHVFAQNLEAGLSFGDALRGAAGNGVSPDDVSNMAATVESGGSVDDALQRAGAKIPTSDRLFISAGSATGRLPRILRTLSERHARLGAVKTRLFLACAYPFAVLHLGFLLFPLLGMIDWEKGFLWDGAAYARSIAYMLLPLWCAGALLVLLARRESSAIFHLARLLPGFRGYVTSQSLADFAFALGNFLDAGLRIDDAWRTAGLITRSPLLRSAAREIDRGIARGEPPGQHLDRLRVFPADFITLYRTGENSGQLESGLLRLAEQNQERAHLSLKFSAMLYPALLLIAVFVAVGWHLVSFASGYFTMLDSLAAP